MATVSIASLGLGNADLTVIGKLSETGLSQTEVADAVVEGDKLKKGNITANQVGAYSKTEVDNLLANIDMDEPDLTDYYTKSETDLLVDVKQDILVSGTNIKTINGQSVLGSGDIEITGEEVDLTNYYDKTQTETLLANKVDKVIGKGLSTNDFTDTFKQAYDGHLASTSNPHNTTANQVGAYSKIETETLLSDKVDKVDTVAYDGHLASTSNPHNTTANQVGAYSKIEVDNLLANIDIEGASLTNYYDKTETETLLSNKVDKVTGKGLSTNDFTDNFKQALELKKVQDISTDSVAKKLVVTYTDGTFVNLNLEDIITDVKVEGAVLDATTSILTIVSSEGGADVVIDLSLFVTTQTLNNALSGKADKIHSHSTSDITGLDTTLSNKVTKNEAIIGATKTKITYDSNGLVINGADLSASDIPNLPQSKIINLETNLSSKIDKDVGVVGATKTKITYNNDGIITGGADLVEADLPNISQAKITNLVSDLSNKQSSLISGTNIKTINGQSVLGNGNIEITGDTGNGIVNILFTSTTDSSGLAGQSGATDTYTIKYSDTTTNTIQLYNGLDGAVQSVAGRVGNVVLTEADITNIDKYTKAEVDAKINAKHSTAFLMAYSN